MAKTLLEIAIEAGVPMPETSVKLNWQTKTKYYWIHIRKDNVWTWFLSFRIDDNLFVIKKNGEIEEYSFGFFEHQIPAPQMHEIAPLLPFKFETNPIGNQEKGRFYHWFSSYSSIGYSNFPLGTYLEEIQLEQSIENNHYAQAYAELYISLREKRLLLNKLT